MKQVGESAGLTDLIPGLQQTPKKQFVPAMHGESFRYRDHLPMGLWKVPAGATVGVMLSGKKDRGYTRRSGCAMFRTA